MQRAHCRGPGGLRRLRSILLLPGGGGQPADEGSVRLGSGKTLEFVSVQADPDDVLWHISTSRPLPALLEQPSKLILNRERRLSLMRYHTVLHVLNTIAPRDYGEWITGVQIATDYSRIDIKLEGFSAALCAELERKVNAVLNGDHAVTSYYLPEAKFHKRDDLLITLAAKLPVSQWHVRVEEIQGFDAQACGGTHVGGGPRCLDSLMGGISSESFFGFFNFNEKHQAASAKG